MPFWEHKGGGGEGSGVGQTWSIAPLYFGCILSLCSLGDEACVEIRISRLKLKDIWLMIIMVCHYFSLPFRLFSYRTRRVLLCFIFFVGVLSTSFPSANISILLQKAQRRAMLKYIRKAVTCSLQSLFFSCLFCSPYFAFFTVLELDARRMSKFNFILRTLSLCLDVYNRGYDPLRSPLSGSDEVD